MLSVKKEEDELLREDVKGIWFYVKREKGFFWGWVGWSEFWGVFRI